jgi:DNA-binding transcriptional LysR family regulator
MELRHLQYFMAVARERSMSRAAERLHLTQPSLSRQIRQLEREIGVELFERSSAGTTLTAAGIALHQHALPIVHLVDTCRQAAQSASEQLREVVAIGIPPGLSTDWVMHMVATVRKLCPQAATTLTEASSADQLRMVREGRLDIGLVHEQPHRLLNGQRLFDQAMGVAVRPGHPLSESGDTCAVSDLDNVRVLAHGRNQVPVTHDRLIVAANDAGAAPLWQFAEFSEHTRACAEAGEVDAVLLTRESAHRRLPGWSWLPLTDPEVRLTTWAVWQHETRDVVNSVAKTVSRLTHLEPQDELMRLP